MKGGAAATAVKQKHRETPSKSISNNGASPTALQGFQEQSLRNLDWQREAKNVTSLLGDLEEDAIAKDENPQSTPDKMFTSIIAMVVLLNIGLMGLELEFMYQKETTGEVDFWYFVELFFLIVFVCEVFVRIAWEKYDWLLNPWSWLDVLCLLPSVISLNPAWSDSVGIFHVIRTVKILRVIRLIKVLKAYRTLYVVIMSWWRAMLGISYVILMIIMGLYIFAVVATEMIGRDKGCKDLYLGDRTAEQLFGSVRRSMFTLFQLMSLQDFAVKTQPLVEYNPGLIIYFFVFVMFFTFGLMNTLVGLVVEKNLIESEKLRGEEYAKEHFVHLSRLLAAFEAMGPNGLSGTVTRSQFESKMKEDEDIFQKVNAVGFPLCNMRDFFNIVDMDGNGAIKEDEFITGCLNFSMVPTDSIYQVATHACVRALDYRLEIMEERMKELCEDMRRRNCENGHSSEAGLPGLHLPPSMPGLPSKAPPDVDLNSRLNELFQVQQRITESLDSTNNLIEERLSHHVKALESVFKDLLSNSMAELPYLVAKHNATMLAEQSGLINEQIDLMRRLESWAADLQRTLESPSMLTEQARLLHEHIAIMRRTEHLAADLYRRHNHPQV